MIDQAEPRLQELASALLREHPFYKNYYSSGSLDFFSLPLMDKRIMNRNRELFTADTLDPDVVESYTSGSTGEPFRCLKTKGELMSLSLAIQRKRRGWGLPLRYRSLLIGNSAGIHPKMLAKYAQDIVKSAPDMIQGRSSILAELVGYFEERSLTVPPNLRFVQSWGEHIYDSDRRLIEKTFGVPLVDYYGMEEVWMIAFTNREGQLEIDRDHVYVETVDPHSGQPVPSGEYGELVITSLVLKRMPFVRYRTGDMGRLLHDEAKGTVTLELLPFRGSQIKLPDRVLSPSVLRYLDGFYKQLSGEIGMRQYQMIQEDYTTFRLKLVAEDLDESKRLEISERLAPQLRQCLLLDKLELHVEAVRSIPPHPVSGKRHPFLCLIGEPAMVSPHKEA
jgi:phenylacetate-CoA ligase